MFKPTTRERFREMLEILPHAHRDAKGFLGGKPSDNLRCTVTGEVRATYAHRVRGVAFGRLTLSPCYPGQRLAT